MSDDDLDHIPSIVPSRDGATAGATRRRGVSGTSARSPRDKKPLASGGGGSGMSVLGRLVLTVALVVAAVACAWAWQLQQQLLESTEVAAGYAQRIGDLEARLSDTDEGMNQNATLQAAKIRELDSEVRKLWDNVWKQSKERLAKLEAYSARDGKTTAANTAAIAAAQAQLKGAATDIARLKSVAGDLERLMTSARANQAEVERVADTLNRIDLEQAKLNKRVQSNEEWIGSINAFRKQVNAQLTDLQASIRLLQNTP